MDIFDDLCQCNRYTVQNGVLLTLFNAFMLTVLGVRLFGGAPLASLTATVSIPILLIDRRGGILLNDPMFLIVVQRRLD